MAHVTDNLNTGCPVEESREAGYLLGDFLLDVLADLTISGVNSYFHPFCPEFLTCIDWESPQFC